MTTLKIKLNDHVEYIRALSDLFHAESALDEALTRLAGAAESPDLAAIFNQHRQVTREQARRLDALLRDGFETAPMNMPGNSITPLINEGDHLIEQMAKGSARDAALLALARRVEQKEASLYTEAIRAAQTIGLPSAYVNILAQAFQEEQTADKALAEIETAQARPGSGEMDPRGF